jgi:AcrR family transcriptional regulator
MTSLPKAGETAAAPTEPPPPPAMASPASPRRTGRRRGPSATQNDIVAAARKLFAEHGYRGATMRAIAAEANVDAALIHHFFTSKEGVFAAAMEDAFPAPDDIDQVVAGGLDGLAERLVRFFLGLWESPDTREPLLAVMRSAVSYDEAARMLAEFVTGRILGAIVRTISQPDPEMRATLIGSQLVGLAMIRYVIKVEPLASADTDTVVAALVPTVDRYLTGTFRPPHS